MLLIDAQPEAGGSYLCHPELGRESARAALQLAQSTGVEVLSATAAFGFIGKTATQSACRAAGTARAASEKALYKLSADRYIYA